MAYAEQPNSGDAPITISAQAADQPWQVYHSDRAGFSIAVPDGWTIQEGAEADGRPKVTLQSADGSAAMAVSVGDPMAAAADLPNTFCGPLSVGGLDGTRCVDTLSGSVVVTVTTAGATFQFVTGRRVDRALFEQVLSTFVLDAPADETSFGGTDQRSIAQPVPAPVAPPPGDRCALGGGVGRPQALCPPP
jgi:hypothetical protein